ncbi:uncharacterized protein [Anabrus simplex]|uniref:uncharacterized protein n=1 Tax=Anabrus simplex TaxID=316456 RepID=UPI0035A3352F
MSASRVVRCYQPAGLDGRMYEPSKTHKKMRTTETGEGESSPRLKVLLMTICQTPRLVSASSRCNREIVTDSADEREYFQLSLQTNSAREKLNSYIGTGCHEERSSTIKQH